MLKKPRQIVVDKDALVGININNLCAFAKNHLMLGCDTLLYECTTASKQEPRDMLDRYKKFIKSGAYYCSCSITFIQSECKNCSPYPWFLPDLVATEQIRKGEARPEDLLNLPMVDELTQPRYKVSKAFLNVVDKIKKRN